MLGHIQMIQTEFEKNMKKIFSCSKVLLGFALIWFPVLTNIGCSKGEVPNSNTDEIESAKFDPSQAKAKGMGAAIPPD